MEHVIENTARRMIRANLEGWHAIVTKREKAAPPERPIKGRAIYLNRELRTDKRTPDSRYTNRNGRGPSAGEGVRLMISKASRVDICTVYYQHSCLMLLKANAPPLK